MQQTSPMTLPHGFHDEPYVAFVNAAGGMPLCDQRFKSLNQSQKQELFWSFFTDDIEGQKLAQTMWTAYGAYHTTVADLLKNPGSPSIGLVVPKSKHVYNALALSDDECLRDIRVRNGADINPFNLTACHRLVNTKYSRELHFDFEGDLIVKKAFAIIDGIARQFGGMDMEGEWHVPEVTRGVVARAVAYMCVLYRLDEFINVSDGDWIKMSRWMQHDPPSKYELQYNRWVKSCTTEMHAGSQYDPKQKRYLPCEGLGISNPFVEFPDLSKWHNLKKLLMSAFNMSGNMLGVEVSSAAMRPVNFPLTLRGVIISAVLPNPAGVDIPGSEYVELTNESCSTKKLGSGYALYVFVEGVLRPTVYDLSALNIQLKPFERAIITFAQSNSLSNSRSVTIDLRYYSTIVHSICYGRYPIPGKVYSAIKL